MLSTERNCQYTSTDFRTKITCERMRLWLRDEMIKSTGMTETTDWTYFTQQLKTKIMYNCCPSTTTIKRITLQNVYSFARIHSHSNTRDEHAHSTLCCVYLDGLSALNMVLVCIDEYNDTVFSDVIIIWSFIAFKRARQVQNSQNENLANSIETSEEKKNHITKTAPMCVDILTTLCWPQHSWCSSTQERTF